MGPTKTFLITGATRGLGLETARALSRAPDSRVVLAVRDTVRGEALAKELGPNVSVLALDLNSLDDVRRFARAWREPLAALINNAGVQNVDRTRLSKDGLEETVAVNHLAASVLTMELLHLLRGGRVLFIGSGTINPGNGFAARIGFRGARFTTVDDLAHGRGDGESEEQRGRDRYATSKMMNTAMAAELARRIPPSTTAFFTLDPGLMAGTGLARTAKLPVRVVWSTVLKWAGPFMAGASTPERSGETAAWIMSEPGLEARSGEVIGPDRRRNERVWEGALQPDVTARVLDETLAFLGLAPLHPPVAGAGADLRRQAEGAGRAEPSHSHA